MCFDGVGNGLKSGMPAGYGFGEIYLISLQNYCQLYMRGSKIWRYGHGI